MDINKILPLVEQAIAGDKKAYSDLCEEIIRDVLYVCIKITGDVQLGEDAAQEALIRMGTYIKKLRNPHAFPLWLNRHLTNSCRNHLRKERRRQGQEVMGQFEDVVENNIEFLPQQWAEREDTSQMVLSALHKLPVRQQHILLMYYFQNMSTREIAAANKISEATARSNLRYARNNLKRHIEKTAGTQLSALPAVAAVPTITLILQKDAARLVTEESAKKALLAVGSALTGGAATVAGIQIATLAASIAPAAAALVLVAATTLVSSPSPSLSPIDGIGITPQYSDSASMQDEGEGDLYSSQPSELASSSGLGSSERIQTSPAPSGDATQAAAYEAEGRIVLTDGQTIVAQHPNLDLGGICVQAYAGDTLACTSYTDTAGRYILRLPDDSINYTVRIANNTLPRIGPQEKTVQLTPGNTRVPILTVTDTMDPVCAVSFLDTNGATGAVEDPHTIEINVYDATPYTAQWQVSPAGTASALHEGSGIWIPVSSLQLPPGKYTLCLQVTDLCGNATQVERQFYIR